MFDRLLERLGSWQCLTTCVVSELALFTVGWFSGAFWLYPLSLPFALAFGMGGAERDLRTTGRRKAEQR